MGETSGWLRTVVLFSLRFRWVVLTLALLLVGWGWYSALHARYDVFPEFAPPQVSVHTEAPGLAPEEVELLVTQPIENAVNGAPGVEALRSNSILGLSVVTVIFRPESDIYRDRQVVSERLAVLAGQLPEGVQAPEMTPLTSSTSTVLIAGLTSDTRTPMELRTVADWTVRRRLLAVPGVASVAVWGGERRQLQIQIRPARLIRFGVGVQDVLEAARRATGIRGAGFVDTENQRIELRTERGRLTPDEVGRTVLVHRGGASVHLSDVAHVVWAPEPPVGAAAILGRPGIQFRVASQFGATTLEVTRGVEAALAELEPALLAQGITLHPDIFRPADFIGTATRSIRSALFMGAGLVLVVLLVFLFDVRTVAISYLAIPLSLLAAVAVMGLMGYTLNTMTLGGLTIAIGVVADDAVIDVENIVRRLREARIQASMRPPWKIVLEASLEVRGAIVYATFAVILVFLPILLMRGLAGRLFGPLAVAFILAVLVSLLVALTVTPALALLLLAHRKLAPEEPLASRSAKRRYRNLLERIQDRPRPVLFTVAALTVAAAGALPFLRGEFIPELKEGHLIVHMAEAPGTSLSESLRLGHRVSEALRRLPSVRSVAQQVGRAERTEEDVFGTHYSEFNVSLKPIGGEASERARDAVRSVVAAFPGASFAINTFLSERVEETFSGFGAPVAVRVYGNDLVALDQVAARVARELQSVPGAADVQVQSPPGMPGLSIHLRPNELERWGFRPLDVLDAVRTAYQGRAVGQVYEGNRVVDATVILAPESRRSIAQIGALPLRNGQGTYVSLRDLAEIYETAGPYQILHEGARRVQTITADVAGTDVASFVERAGKRLRARVPLPPGSYLEFAGTALAQTRTRTDLLLQSLLVGVGVVLLLSFVTGHRRNLLLILANIPFALVGGVLAAFLGGGTVSIGGLVGFVTLFGITIRNSIMLISHYEHLVRHEGRTWGRETALDGAVDRFLPILMTSLVTGLALLPLAVGMNAPGREIEGPMAVVILGGLLTSMVLNVLVLPMLAVRYGRFEALDEVWA